MSRRLTTFVLAAFYLLQAAWLLHAGMDLMLPTVRQAVAAAPDSCCSKACGCPEDVKAVYGCCCSPGKVAPAPQPAKVSFLEAARCRGVDAAMTQAFTQPVVCAFAAVPAAETGATLFSAPEPQPHIPPAILVLDKVPIA